MRHPRARQALITTSAASKRVMILHGEGSAVRIHVKGHATKRMYGLGHVVDLNADNHIRVGLRGKPYLSRRWPGQRRAGRLPKCCASSGTVNCLYPARARHEARVSRSSRPHSLSLGRQLGEAVEWRARGAAPQAAPRAAKERQFGRRPPAAAPGAARLPILRRARHLSGVWRPGGCSWYAQHAQRCVAPARTRATAAFVATPCYCASCRECSTQWLRTVSVLWLHVAELLDAARAWQSGMQRAAWRQEGSKGGVVISVRRNRRVGRRARAARFLIHRTCR